MSSADLKEAEGLEEKIEKIVRELANLAVALVELEEHVFNTNSDRVGLIANVSVALRDYQYVNRKANNLFRSRKCDNYINRLQSFYGKLLENVEPNLAIVRTHAQILGVSL